MKNKAPLALLFFLLSAPLLFSQKPKDCTLLGSDWKNFSCQALSPTTLIFPAGSALGGRYIFNSPGFEPGWEGLLHRYGVSVGDNVNGKLMSAFVLPKLTGHHQQPYYFMGDGKDGWKAHWHSRIANIAKHSLLADPAQGWDFRNTNWSNFPAAAAAAGLSNTYHPPQQRSVSATLSRMLISAGVYSLRDLGSELFCDTKFLGLHNLVTCLHR